MLIIYYFLFDNVKIEWGQSVTSDEYCLLINPKRTLNISFLLVEDTSLNFISSGLALFFNVNPMPIEIILIPNHWSKCTLTHFNKNLIFDFNH